MQTNNPRYLNQGIHVIVSVISVSGGKLKVLLAKRKNAPYTNFWALLGGAVYNDETLETAVKREIFEKSGIENITPMQYKLFSDPNRAKETGFRMLGIAYVVLVDESVISFTKQTEKTSDMEWFNIDDVPTLAYDHNQVLNDSIDYLKNKINSSVILKNLYPNDVTIPELQSVYETILGESLDRRNFRKKLLQENVIIDTGREKQIFGKKPCKIYEINCDN